MLAAESTYYLILTDTEGFLANNKESNGYIKISLVSFVVHVSLLIFYE